MKQKIITAIVILLFIGAFALINYFNPQRIWERDTIIDERSIRADQAEIDKKSQSVREAERDAALIENQIYLNKHAAEKGVVVTDSGLQYKILREGDGDIGDS